jgi:hypothetical protein
MRKEKLMLKRDVVRTKTSPAFALITILLLAALAGAQKGPQATTGAPLKGVDVKLGKNPGGSPASRTTDENGHVNLGVLEKGSYYLIVERRRQKTTENAVGEMRKAGGEADADADTSACTVTLTGVVGGTRIAAWDFEKNKTFDPSSADARAGRPKYMNMIVFESDGVHPVEATIVKSKSNITNN